MAPGVSSASLVNSPPFGRPFIRAEFEIQGQPNPTLDAGRPKIEADSVLNIVDGRHPVLDILEPQGTFVPNDAAVGGEAG